MRNSLVLDEIFEDSQCAIVFQVEYVINIPIQVDFNTNQKNKVIFV